MCINNCDLSDSQLVHLSEGIQENQSIVLLDLSFNKLGRTAGYQLGKILSSHCQRRNDIIWNIKLRDEYVEEDLALMGICELNVQANQLDFKAIKDLCFFLRQDNWTRVSLFLLSVSISGKITSITMQFKKSFKC